MKQVVTIPAPTAGWNSTFPVTNLAPNEAIVLDNMIPDTGVLTTRNGSELYVSLVDHMPTGVKGLFEFKAAMLNKFIATGGGKFVDISNNQNPIVIGSGYQNDYWNSTIFGGTAQSVIAFVNGVDTPLYYDGTPAMQLLGVTGNGLNPNNLIDAYNFKNRVWFVEANSQNAWYSPLNALIGGQVLTKFYIGNLASFGGNLVTIKSFSADGGSGRQEFLTFYMSSGEIIIYQGDDPADANNFRLVGIYKSGRPINSPRAVCKFGADIIALTDSGYFPISSLLPYSFGKSNDPLAEKIRGAAVSAVNANFTAANWQILLLQNLGILLVNVPTNTAGVINQHVLNVNTMAWCSFSNIISNVWVMFGNNVYFGDTNGKVWQYTGSSDYADPNDAESGQEIVMTVTLPYLFNQPSGLKQSTAFRPRLLLNGYTTMTVSASADFSDYSPPYQVVTELDGIQWGASPANPYVNIVANNPLTSFNNSSIIHVTIPDTSVLTEGQQITIRGATGFGGLTAAQLNITCTVSIVSATVFSYNIQVINVAASTGGGNAISYSLYSPGAPVLPANPGQQFFGANDPGLNPVGNVVVAWGRPPVGGGIYEPGPAQLPNPVGDPLNAPYYGADDPGYNPPGEIGWATGTSSSLGYLNLNYMFYSLSIQLIFTSHLPVNYYETDFLLKGSQRI